MRLEPDVPITLFNIQNWFQSVITLPIGVDNEICSERLISEEASQYIAPNSYLSSEERIGLYHQQYWWRLLSNLHHSFPMVVRLFGLENFNLFLGVPYLSKYPSRHWSISRLGDRMLAWIQESYFEKDKPLVFFSALLDLAYESVFSAASPVFFAFSHNILKEKLALQSHVKLLKMPFNLLSFRLELLKEDENFWIENEFPELSKGEKHFILYRNNLQRILFQELEEGHWMILNALDKGLTIEEACDALELQGGNPYEEAKNGLAQWIHDWQKNNWLQVSENLS